jgi:hypothetical protein
MPSGRSMKNGCEPSTKWDQVIRLVRNYPENIK